MQLRMDDDKVILTVNQDRVTLECTDTLQAARLINFLAENDYNNSIVRLKHDVLPYIPDEPEHIY